MKARIVSGIVAAAIVCFAVFAGKEIFDIACVILSFIAVNEFFDAFEKKGYKPLQFAGYISCLVLLLGAVGGWNRSVWRWLMNIINFIDIRFLLYFALIAMFCFLIFQNGKYTVSDLAVTIFGAFYVCFLFWYLILIRNLPYGNYAVWFVLLGATMTDTCAYFVGTVFGKHKLIPAISPKKTIEGAIGGAVACVIVFIAYGLVFNHLAYRIPMWKYFGMGCACGVISQIGDLAASCIKRFCGIKDFGRIIPGHGGILDRLDSVLVLSPLIYIILT